jgi:hypothetical protein
MRTYRKNVPDTEELYYTIPVTEFDDIIDSGAEMILLVSPHRRFVAYVDEWLEYGQEGLAPDGTPVRFLNKSYMGD